MDCQLIQSSISLYIDNELNPDEKQRFEAHIRNCKTCKKELEIYQALSHQLEDIDCEKTLPTDYHNALMAKIKSMPKSNKKNRFNHSFYYSSAAAIIVILIISTVFLKDYFYNQSLQIEEENNMIYEIAKDESIEGDNDFGSLSISGAEEDSSNEIMVQRSSELLEQPDIEFNEMQKSKETNEDAEIGFFSAAVTEDEYEEDGVFEFNIIYTVFVLVIVLSLCLIAGIKVYKKNKL
ncbi:putative zinc finger protein [Natranaerovirga hydrolytica]|uniref:Anti-sigma-W factor RsiW n=1 Tax=Natranaerovirga hydrolytica TaxID=680378 RepID=A0A4R1MYB7_9FIRM|nr:zf-HC2 domain-containing protein [Natranaerovirga hydrolytica]TCK98206.1 putative zinc finger protein [Natranaerovirga hydrolytica]